MSTVKMKKMTVYGLKSEKQSVMYLLQRMGVMEITEMEDLDPEYRVKKEAKADVAIAQKKANEIDSVIASIKGALDKKAKLPKPQCGLKEINDAGAQVDKLDACLSEIAGVVELVENGKSEIARLEGIVSSMETYKTMSIPVETIGETEFTTSYIAKVSADDLSAVNEAVSGLECSIDVIYQDKSDAYFLLLAHNTVISEVNQAMRKVSYTKVDLSIFRGLKGVPKDIIQESLAQLTKEKASLEQNTAKLAGYQSEFPFLMMNYEFYNIKLQQEEGTSFGAETESAFVVEGWVAANNVENIQKSIANLTPNAYAQAREPYGNEKAPTVLKNSKLIRPFEAVTDMYSTPVAGQYDPNTIMAPFFFIFFGMMFGDIGYGLILAIGSFFFIKKYNPQGPMMSKLVRLISICSIGTIAWGLLTASGLSFTIPNIKPVFDPMNNPVPVLILSYALGVAHLFLGYILAAYLSFKAGDWFSAIFDQIAWLAFYVGILLWLGSAVIPAIPSMVGMWVTIGAAATLVATQGRSKPSIVGKAISGVLSLYGSTGFLSDVLSYSRLFAIGLSGAVIGLVVNMVAEMLLGVWFLMPFGIIIFIGGHIFNIAISLLGAYVHACRLQYIEFYGKFYEGGGVPFKPLGLKTKYVKLS